MYLTRVIIFVVFARIFEEYMYKKLYQLDKTGRFTKLYVQKALKFRIGKAPQKRRLHNESFLTNSPNRVEPYSLRKRSLLWNKVDFLSFFHTFSDTHNHASNDITRFTKSEILSIQQHSLNVFFVCM